MKVLKACVPAAVPGIAFLSGGQSDEEATAHLDAMNKIGGLPWKLTFSYGRALQHAPQTTWAGKSENVAAAQRAFSHRAMMNGLAALGQWKQDLERKAAPRLRLLQLEAIAVRMSAARKGSPSELVLILARRSATDAPGPDTARSGRRRPA